VRWCCQELPQHLHGRKPDEQPSATPPADHIRVTWDPTPMRHIITVTRRIAEALASNFSRRPRLPAIGTTDLAMCIIGVMAGILNSRSMLRQVGA
jgi:hypothetical protein